MAEEILDYELFRAQSSCKEEHWFFFCCCLFCFHLESYYENFSFFKQSFYFLVVEAGKYGITRNIVRIYFMVYICMHISNVSVYPKLMC